MQEILFTPEEITFIQSEANKIEWSENELFIGLGNKKTDVFRVSRNCTWGPKLIMPRGNISTGLDHIIYRHHFGRQEWKEGKDYLDVSSEIRKGVAPIEYIALAESIYKPENLQTEGNKRPSEFDLYIGDHIHWNGDSIEYLLLTYKGTGVIHNLYPRRSQNNRNRSKKFKYRQYQCSYQADLMRAIHTYTMPYKDKQEREVFRIVARGVGRYPAERVYVQINEGNKVPPQTVFIREILSLPFIDHSIVRGIAISDADKSDFERAAIDILEGRYDYGKEDSLYRHPIRTADSIPSYFAW